MASLAVLNIRLDEEMKKRLEQLAKKVGTTQTELVKGALSEKLVVQERASVTTSTTIPQWVPDKKYVALVRGAVAAVGDSVAEVTAVALNKFKDEPIYITRKGAPVKRVHYAFFALGNLKCWKYVIVDKESYPVIPATIMGKREMTVASIPDTAASLTMVSSSVVDELELEIAGKESVVTAAGVAQMKTFNAVIELPTGRHATVVGSLDIPKTLPFQVLLGRSLLDKLDLHAFGKNQVVCISDL